MIPEFGHVALILALAFALVQGVLPLFGASRGNGTLIGASANLTVAGLAERNGVPFRFLTYILYAAPMTVVSIGICHLYVWLRYF